MAGSSGCWPTGRYSFGAPGGASRPLVLPAHWCSRGQKFTILGAKNSNLWYGKDATSGFSMQFRQNYPPKTPDSFGGYLLFLHFIFFVKTYAGFVSASDPHHTIFHAKMMEIWYFFAASHKPQAASHKPQAAIRSAILPLGRPATAEYS